MPRVDRKFVLSLQRRTAEVAIGPSTLRNQGAPGVVQAARDALLREELARFVVASQEDFARELNLATVRLQRKLPRPAQWGTARKALNIFLRDVLYNTYLAREFGFRRIERWLELPLDSYTVKALRRERIADDLPRWPGVGKVTPATYALYQAAAEEAAQKRQIARVHLDILWWRPPPPSPS